jgi:hypothetical protein
MKQEILSDYIRLPKHPAKCKFTGLSRSTVLDIAVAAKAVRRLKIPGNSRGTVLIHKAKLLKWIETQCAE